MAQVDLVYSRGGASATELREAIDDVLDELDLGDSRVTVSVAEEQGMDPLTAGILIGMAGNVASHYLIKVLETQIWPRVRARLGEDAIGARETAD